MPKPKTLAEVVADLKWRLKTYREYKPGRWLEILGLKKPKKR